MDKEKMGFAYLSFLRNYAKLWYLICIPHMNISTANPWQMQNSEMSRTQDFKNIRFCIVTFNHPSYKKHMNWATYYHNIITSYFYIFAH
jgi:hypothetical protein